MSESAARSGDRAANNGDRRSNPTITQSLQEYGRGIAGGLLFSLPILFTQEVWQYGFLFDPVRMIIYVSVTFVLLMGYNRYVGIRHESHLLEVVIDSIEEMGLGLVLAFVVLLLLGRVDISTSISETIGRVAVEGMTVAIGISVGTAQLGSSAEDQDKGSPGAEESDVKLHEQLLLGFIGAMLIGGNVAPTDEVTIIAMHATTWQLIGIAVFSMALSAVVTFYSDFIRATKVSGFDERTWYGVILRTFSFYVISLLAATLSLWAFARFEGMPLPVMIAQVIVLGLVSSLGGSAGRLLLQ